MCSLLLRGVQWNRKFFQTDHVLGSITDLGGWSWNGKFSEVWNGLWNLVFSAVHVLSGYTVQPRKTEMPGDEPQGKSIDENVTVHKDIICHPHFQYYSATLQSSWKVSKWLCRQMENYCFIICDNHPTWWMWKYLQKRNNYCNFQTLGPRLMTDRNSQINTLNRTDTFILEMNLTCW